MIIGAPSESYPGERRVALVPAVVPGLLKAGLEVLVERGAGSGAGFPDAAYAAQGARVAAGRAELFSQAGLVVVVRGLGANPDAGRADLELLQTGQIAVGFFDPLGAPEAARELARRGVTAFSLELLPRISRAQPMDALTSMATVAGYKAVLLAAATLPRFFPMMITAAGTVTPARVLVIGAGVNGLQAIATARRLGAVVSGYDLRPAVKEQVESLGARFLELELETEDAEAAGGYAREMDEAFYQRQRELMGAAVADSDVVITTATVPGAKAPVLITEAMVRGMSPGSLIVDLAAETGGNCELTRAGETLEAHGVVILGPVNLAATVPYHASQMYARNVAAFLQHIVKDGEVALDMDDQITRETLLTHGGEVVSPRVRERLGLPAAPAPDR